MAQAQPSNRSSLISIVRLAALLAACGTLYAILHDQITARICVEYFTVTHPTIIPSQNPTSLAIAWGIVAGGPPSLGLGVLVALCARVGRWPKLSTRSVMIGTMCVFVVMAIGAAIMGFLGSIYGASVAVGPADIDPDLYGAWFTVAHIHAGTYFLGVAGSLTLAIAVVLLRWRSSCKQRRGADS